MKYAQGKFRSPRPIEDIISERRGLSSTDANARLIAAAPDLLAALQALEWSVSGVAYIEEEYAEQVKAARAAIAKATT